MSKTNPFGVVTAWQLSSPARGLLPRVGTRRRRWRCYGRLPSNTRVTRSRGERLARNCVPRPWLKPNPRARWLAGISDDRATDDTQPYYPHERASPCQVKLHLHDRVQALARTLVLVCTTTTTTTITAPLGFPGEHVSCALVLC